MRAFRSATARAVSSVIASAREKAGLTQRDLAKRLKWPHSVIGMIEADQRQVKIPEFVAIAAAIDIDPEELFKSVLVEHAAGARAGGFGVVTVKQAGKKRPAFRIITPLPQARASRARAKSAARTRSRSKAKR